MVLRICNIPLDCLRDVDDEHPRWLVVSIFFISSVRTTYPLGRKEMVKYNRKDLGEAAHAGRSTRGILGLVR